MAPSQNFPSRSPGRLETARRDPLPITDLASGFYSMRIFSAIQPTGQVHLGNLYGALLPWVKLHQIPSNQCIFAIADLHALSSLNTHTRLQLNIHTVDMMAQFMAIGLSPDKAIIFRQSSVAAHSQLHWILSNYAPIGHLKRMTQFKSRGGNNGLSLGIFSYPVLQAADILLYNTEGVPVGHDQLQHLELSRQIATSFNHLVDGQLFTVPEPIAGRIPRVMSLRDGLKKMSKSDPSAMSRIHITDNNDEIKLKIRKATTDSIGNISYDESQRPEISNLVRIMAELTDQAPEQVCEKFDGCTTVQFKDQLTERLIELITPMRDTYHRVRADQAYLNHIFASNADRANVQAERTLARVHTALGLAPLETETVLPNRNLSYSKPAFD